MQSEVPKGTTVNHNENQMLIKLRWFRLGRLPMVIATLVIVVLAWKTGRLYELLVDPRMGLKILGVLFCVGILFSCYANMAMLLNTTYILAGKQAIRVVHRPLPWRGNRKIEEAVCELKVEQVVRRNDGHNRVSYQMWATL